MVAPSDSLPALPVQAAHVAESTVPAVHADASIPGAVGDANWGDAFSQRVVWMVGERLQSAEFRVEPPQLGPIQVRLSITNDQANLLFNAPHAVAREAIQTALPRLQEMLLESGVALGNVSVGTGSHQDQTDFAFRHSSAHGDGAPPAASSTAGIAVAVRRGIGLVDLFA
jgi:flagellar hook-length control protein FliK